MNSEELNETNFVDKITEENEELRKEVYMLKAILTVIYDKVEETRKFIDESRVLK